MKVLIVVPAHNEEKALPMLVRELVFLKYDFLIVNDCSSDRTEQILDENHWNHINLPNNIGLAGVTQMGFKYAVENHYDAAIVIDGDGQHPPNNIRLIIDELEKGYDYVIGSRYVNSKKPWSFRMLGSRIICFFLYIKTGRFIHDPTSGMRGLNQKALKDFSENMNYVAEPDALVHLLKREYKVIEVPVTMEERETGVSYFHSPLKSIRFMFDILMSIVFIQW